MNFSFGNPFGADVTNLNREEYIESISDVEKWVEVDSAHLFLISLRRGFGIGVPFFIIFKKINLKNEFAQIWDMAS